MELAILIVAALSMFTIVAESCSVFRPSTWMASLAFISVSVLTFLMFFKVKVVAPMAFPLTPTMLVTAPVPKPVIPETDVFVMLNSVESSWPLKTMTFPSRLLSVHPLTVAVVMYPLATYSVSPDLMFVIWAVCIAIVIADVPESMSFILPVASKLVRLHSFTVSCDPAPVTDAIASVVPLTVSKVFLSMVILDDSATDVISCKSATVSSLKSLLVRVMLDAVPLYDSVTSLKEVVAVTFSNVHPEMSTCAMLSLVKAIFLPLRFVNVLC